MPATLIAMTFLSILVAVFAIQNAGVVEISFLGWTWQASLALVVLATFGVGILIGYLASLPSTFRKGKELRHQKQKVAALESTVPSEPEPPEVPEDPEVPGDEGHPSI